MHRRNLLQLLAFGAVAQSLVTGSESHANTKREPEADRPKFVMLIHPDMVLLDLVPALTAFKMTGGDVQLVWKDGNPIKTDIGVEIQPTTVLSEADTSPDVLFVPGGLRGTVACMEDPEIIEFVARVGNASRYVTSVCTGSLLLGAAGLLKGYRATGHWQSRDALTKLGAILDDGRVVTDRNRITGGGVTAGLDFGLTVAARVRDEEWAKSIQLILEYAPAPPYDAGTVDGAGPAVTARVSELLKPGLAPLDQAVTKARQRLQL